MFAFVLACFNNTYFVSMSVLKTRKSEAVRLFRRMQARFGQWNLDLQSCRRSNPKNCDTRELPKLAGRSVHEQDQDSIITYFSWFLALSPSFLKVCVFSRIISVRSVLDLEVKSVWSKEWTEENTRWIDLKVTDGMRQFLFKIYAIWTFVCLFCTCTVFFFCLFFLW